MHDPYVISLHITPKSAQSEILGWVADAHGHPVLKVRIKAPPENGKANAELVRFLAKTWRIAQSNITLISGDTSRHKRLKIQTDKPIPFLDASLS